MTQRDLNRQLANMTGESIRVIRRLGFGLLDDSLFRNEESDSGPRMVNWDALEAERELASVAPGYRGPRRPGLRIV